jgi:hypothetical protein
VFSGLFVILLIKAAPALQRWCPSRDCPARDAVPSRPY